MKKLIQWLINFFKPPKKEETTKSIRDENYISTAFDLEIIRLINEYRQSQNLTVLSTSALLAQIGATHSKEMAAKEQESHDGFTERAAWFPQGRVGENVAYGYSTANSFFNAWRKSDGHRKRMLGDYQFVGVSTAENADKSKYVTALFLKM